MSQPNEIEIQKFARRVSELRNAISQIDPIILARNTDSQIVDQQEGELEFHLEMWGRSLRLPLSTLEAYNVQNAGPLPLIDQAMILYYFRYADGTSLMRRWISFAELPDGRFYNQAFQGYTGQTLSRYFSDQGERFILAAENLGGESYPLGSAAYIFKALPRVPIMVVFWQGDEDFPSSFQVLFDAAANHYLPTDGYAILGSAITRKLIKADKTGNLRS